MSVLSFWGQVVASASSLGRTDAASARKFNYLPQDQDMDEDSDVDDLQNDSLHPPDEACLQSSGLDSILERHAHLKTQLSTRSVAAETFASQAPQKVQQLISSFCRSTSVTRVAPTEKELEEFWSKCDAVIALTESQMGKAMVSTAIVYALSAQLSSPEGHEWKPQLRALSVLSFLHGRPGVERFVTQMVISECQEMLQHLSTDVEQCRELALHVLEFEQNLERDPKAAFDPVEIPEEDQVTVAGSCSVADASSSDQDEQFAAAWPPVTVANDDGPEAMNIPSEQLATDCPRNNLPVHKPIIDIDTALEIVNPAIVIDVDTALIVEGIDAAVEVSPQEMLSKQCQAECAPAVEAPPISVELPTTEMLPSAGATPPLEELPVGIELREVDVFATGQVPEAAHLFAALDEGPNDTSPETMSAFRTDELAEAAHLFAAPAEDSRDKFAEAAAFAAVCRTDGSVEAGDPFAAIAQGLDECPETAPFADLAEGSLLSFSENKVGGRTWSLDSVGSTCFESTRGRGESVASLGSMEASHSLRQMETMSISKQPEVRRTVPIIWWGVEDELPEPEDPFASLAEGSLMSF
jgi:hypothetical protein